MLRGLMVTQGQLESDTIIISKLVILLQHSNRG